ncbi:MAG: ferritin [Candidatus Tectimicrobiota bacterium]|nr:MAG: ferritin [Candidatus Tectomicrobia bacterium]
MATSSASYHEPLDKLSPATMDYHRALVSLQEELEAVDWYQQRADACGDDELRAILLHNMREEIEHASMLLEWLRRHHPDFDRCLRTYLFTTQRIVELESNGEAAAVPPSPRAFTIGSLRDA